MKNTIFIISSFLLTVFLSACEENSSNTDSTNQRKQSIGRFIDAPVQNLDVYQNGIKITTTDNNGFFEYREGNQITFKVGKLILGSTKPKPVITPLDLSQNNKNVIKVLIILQSLDEDKNPDNGIYINNSTKERLKTDVDISDSSVSISKYIKNHLPSLDIVTFEHAVNHFQKSAKQYNFEAKHTNRLQLLNSEPFCSKNSNALGCEHNDTSAPNNLGTPSNSLGGQKGVTDQDSNSLGGSSNSNSLGGSSNSNSLGSSSNSNSLDGSSNSNSLSGSSNSNSLSVENTKSIPKKNNVLYNFLGDSNSINQSANYSC